MTVSEAAKALGITTVSVYRLIQRGTLTAVGSDPVRLDPEDVLQYKILKGNSRVPADAIRADYAAGGVTQAQLAERYGCHVATISRLVRKGRG